MRVPEAFALLALPMLVAGGCDRPTRGGSMDRPEKPGVTLSVDRSEIVEPRVGIDSLSRAIWRPVALRPLAGGGFVVVSAGHHRVVELHPDGTPKSWWGQEGKGPQDFDGVREAYFCQNGDITVVQRGRVGVFSGSGVLRHVVRMPDLLDGGIFDVLGVSEDCERALVEQRLRTYGDAALNEPVADTAVIAWSSFSTPDVDTVGIFPAQEVILRDLAGRAIVPARFAWGVAPEWRVGLGGVVHVPNDAYEVRILSDGGEVLGQFEWSGPSREIADEEWDQYFEVRDQIVAANPREALMMPTRAEHPRREKPIARSVFIDPEGRIWIERFQVPWLVEAPDRQIWWIFSESGEWLAEVKTPPRFRVMAAAKEYAWGVTMDALDRELLSRVPLGF